jgi:2-oxoisovalerate dehydrogenase E2 component (dihydrolipoyl transacylase)
LTSPTVGVVKRLGAEEGIVVKVGEVICDIETEGEGEVEGGSERQEVEPEPEAVEVELDEPAHMNGKTESASTPHDIDADTPPPRSSTNEDDLSLHQSRDPLLDNSQGAQFSGEAAMLPSPPPSRSTPSHTPMDRIKRTEQPWSELRKIVKASPAIRTLAARMGIELAGVKGSGEGGRVLRDDLLAFESGSGSGVASVSVGKMEESDRYLIPTTTRVEFGRTRKVMYRALGDMGKVPHFG